MLARPYLDETSSGKHYAKESGTTHRRTVPLRGGQIKRSFSSKEQAATAGAAIKKAYPVVVVGVVDTKEGITEIINA
jgi:hypothetical protein